MAVNRRVPTEIVCNHTYGQLQSVLKDFSRQEQQCIEWIYSVCGWVPSTEQIQNLERVDCIYAMTDTRRGLVKIGRSFNPQERAIELRMKMRRRSELSEDLGLTILLKIPPRLAGSLDIEAGLHFQFADLQAPHPLFPGSPEWFRLEGSLAVLIANAGGG